MTIAIIAARGGSKGVKRKNLRTVAGIPLVAHSIVAAHRAGLSCYVSTECPDIAEVARGYGAKVIDRPQALATDRAESKNVITHAVGALGYRGDIVYLSPTYPTRTQADIEKHLEFYRASKAPSAICGYVPAHHPQLCLVGGKPACGLVYRRQDRAPAVVVSHFVVAAYSEELHNLDQGFWCERTSIRMLPEQPIDIDTEEDIQKANAYLL